MDDKKSGHGDEQEHEYIFRTLQDEKNRDVLHGIVEPLVKSVLTSELVDVENNIKRDVSQELGDTVKALVEKNLKDIGVPLKRKGDIEIGEDVGSSNSKKHCVEYESNKYEREYTSADEAIADWRKLANNEWESARRTDLTDLKGIITVICLDTSASMNENNAWEHSKHFITDYLETTEELHSGADLVALVTFGKETKVQSQFTRDYEGLKSELEKLKPEGSSPIYGGLVLSKAVAKTSDFFTMFDRETRVLPKIILITDGKPTDIKVINGPERTDYDDVKQTLRIIEDEAKTFTEKEIELHIVHVGKPDYDFLHLLQDCTGGLLMTYKEAGKMGLNIIVDIFIRQINLRRELSKRKDSQESEGSERGAMPELVELSKTFQKITEKFLEKLEQMPSFADLMEILEKMRKNTRNKYYVEEDQRLRYPRIGSRVRRAQDWKYSDQDGNGPGTIIGHCYKVNTDDPQIQVWVEWDEDERQNIYKYKTFRGTKKDIRIVEEERVPPEDKVLAVGMKVGIGPDYSGERKPRQGVVIRIIDDNEYKSPDDDDRSPDDDGSRDVEKAEVLWEDNERGIYYFGDKCSKVEIEPRIQYTKPDKPQKIMITEVSEKEVCLEWDRPASCGGCSIKKYIVYKKSDKLNSKWSNALEVEGSETKATVADLEQNEKYKFAVVAENKIGSGDMAETHRFVKLNVSICKPEPPAGPLNIKHVTKSSCTVCWNESPVCEKKPVKHYIIEIREAGKPDWKKVRAEGPTVYKVTQLRKSTTYELQVKSVNDTGVSEPLGTESFITKTFLGADIPKIQLQDKHLAQLSTALAGDWQLLGPYLGLNNVEMDHMESQNKSSGPAMLIYRMLSVWRQRNPDTATFYELIEGIEAVPAVTVDWDKISDVARSIKETI